MRVASSLQQTTWLRKNFAVKLATTNSMSTSALAKQQQHNKDEWSLSSLSSTTDLETIDRYDVDTNMISLAHDQIATDPDKLLTSSDSMESNDSNNNIMQSYQALNILAEVLFTLDSVWCWRRVS
jgi:hypothetical protein